MSHSDDINSVGQLSFTLFTAGLTVTCCCLPGVGVITALSSLLSTAAIAAGLGRFGNGAAQLCNPPKEKKIKKSRGYDSEEDDKSIDFDERNPGDFFNKVAAVAEMGLGGLFTSVGVNYGITAVTASTGVTSLSSLAALPAIHMVCLGFAINAITEFLADAVALYRFSNSNKGSTSLGAQSEFFQMKREVGHKGMRADLWILSVVGMILAHPFLPLIISAGAGLAFHTAYYGRGMRMFKPAVRSREQCDRLAEWKTAGYPCFTLEAREQSYHGVTVPPRFSVLQF